MRQETAVVVKFALLAAAGAVIVAVARQTLDSYMLSIVMFTGINVILAVSLNITNGFIGLFSLGHPAFMTLGGYLSAILVMSSERKGLMLPNLPGFLVGQEWAFLPALLAGGLLAAIAAVIVGFPVLRLRGHYLAVATLGMIFIVQSMAINLDGLTRGALGLSGLPALTTLWWVYLFMIVTLYVCWRLKHSSLGRTMLAVRENELAAACLGVRVARTRILAFALGAFFAGVSGGLWVHVVTLVSPSSFSFLLAFHLVVMVVIGGAGSITGAALAALVITIATELLKPVEEAMGLYGLSQVIIAIGVILILIYRPSGLFGTSEPALFGWARRYLRTSQPEGEPTK